jgi:tetratricopeptide (TPR) repeat protein
MRGRLAAWSIAFAVAALPGLARANDFDQFQNARVAYESANYELAADLFRDLLRDATPDDSRPLMIESRKYLAATHLFLGEVAKAEAQLERLLKAEPDYVLDPLAFPAEFGKIFAAIRERLEKERAQQAEQDAQTEAERQAAHELAQRRKRERLSRLLQLASTERVEQVRSRWIALLPFGIGQFQNGNDELGLVLAVTEGTLLAAGVVTYALHESLRDENPTLPEDRNSAELAEASSRYANQVALGLFAAVAITGIIDAQIRFKARDSFERPRPLPPELKELELSVGPGALVLHGRF